jgi:hypothetical protein
MSLSPLAIFSAIFIGLIGMALFIYGKKQAQAAPLLTGVALCVFPYFVTSIVLMWLITAACLGGLYYIARHA